MEDEGFRDVVHRGRNGCCRTTIASDSSDDRSDIVPCAVDSLVGARRRARERLTYGTGRADAVVAESECTKGRGAGFVERESRDGGGDGGDEEEGEGGEEEEGSDVKSFSHCYSTVAFGGKCCEGVRSVLSELALIVRDG